MLYQNHMFDLELAEALWQECFTTFTTLVGRNKVFGIENF